LEPVVLVQASMEAAAHQDQTAHFSILHLLAAAAAVTWAQDNLVGLAVVAGMDPQPQAGLAQQDKEIKVVPAAT
jgi:hypothetical protein